MSGKNKAPIDPQLKKGVYALSCPCSDNAIYVGQTSRNIQTHMQEHRNAFEKKNWTHSGIVAHKEHCPFPVDWDNPTVLDVMSNKNRQALKYGLRLRESLHIAKMNSGPGHGLNEDWGEYLKTRAWLPVFDEMS